MPKLKKIASLTGTLVSFMNPRILNTGSPWIIFRFSYHSLFPPLFLSVHGDTTTKSRGAAVRGNRRAHNNGRVSCVQPELRGKGSGAGGFPRHMLLSKLNRNRCYTHFRTDLRFSDFVPYLYVRGNTRRDLHTLVWDAYSYSDRRVVLLLDLWTIFLNYL